MANDAQVLSQLKQNLKERLGYFSWSELVLCACMIAKKNGVHGSKEMMAGLNKIASSLQVVMDFTTMMTSGMDALVKMITDALSPDVLLALLGVDPIRKKLYDEVNKMKLCPILSRILTDLIKDLNIILDIRRLDFMVKILKAISGYNNRFINLINKFKIIISTISKLIALMEMCARDFDEKSSNKTYSQAAERTTSNALLFASSSEAGYNGVRLSQYNPTITPSAGQDIANNLSLATTQIAITTTQDNLRDTVGYENNVVAPIETANSADFYKMINEGTGTGSSLDLVVSARNAAKAKNPLIVATPIKDNTISVNTILQQWERKR